MSPVLPLNEHARELIIQVARGLEPSFAEITQKWRERVGREFGFDPRTLAALKRLTIATGCTFFCAGDFSSFFENVEYFASRLAKLEVDTRAVSRALELHDIVCEEYLEAVFHERKGEARAALQLLDSATFVALSGAYFDAKTAESQALLELTEADVTSPDVSTLLHKALQVVLAAFDSRTGGILLKDPESGDIGLEAAIGMDSEDYGLTIPVGQGFTGRIVESGERQIVLDTALDDRVMSPTLRRKSKTLWGVPLHGPKGVIGALVLGYEKPYYEWLPREARFLQAMADRAAMSIERARMLAELREREATIARLSGHLLTAQEEERKRISRELHDETGQALMVIRLYLGMLDGSVKTPVAKSKIKETVDVVDRTVEGLRRIMGKLSPLVLQELGMVAAIRKEVKDLAKNTGVKARCTITDDIGGLVPQMEVAMYRIVQEALHNVAKHAQAKCVSVHISLQGNDLLLVIEDDGIGMGLALAQKNAARGQSFGLAGIKERVSMMGGCARVTSLKGRGTRIEIQVPIARTDAADTKDAKPVRAEAEAPAALSAANGANHG